MRTKRKITPKEYLDYTNFMSKLRHGAKVFIYGKIQVLSYNRKSADKKVIKKLKKITSYKLLAMYLLEIVSIKDLMFLISNGKDDAIVYSDKFESRLKKHIKNFKSTNYEYK